MPALRLAYDVAERGGTLGAVLNGANAVAVEAFLSGTIAFFEMSRIVERTIQQHRLEPKPTLDALLEADRWARRTARALTAEG